MKTFSLGLDLLGALSLFNYIQEHSGQDGSPELESLEASLRLFLYNELSIEEMEQPRALERRLRAEREARKAWE